MIKVSPSSVITRPTRIVRHRSFEWSISQTQRCRCSCTSKYISIVLTIMTHDPGLNLNLIYKAIRKSGRIGRSIIRIVRISFSFGAPSRFLKPPGTFQKQCSTLGNHTGVGKSLAQVVDLLAWQSPSQQNLHKTQQQRRSPIWRSFQFQIAGFYRQFLAQQQRVFSSINLFKNHGGINAVHAPKCLLKLSRHDYGGRRQTTES